MVQRAGIVRADNAQRPRVTAMGCLHTLFVKWNCLLNVVNDTIAAVAVVITIITNDNT